MCMSVATVEKFFDFQGEDRIMDIQKQFFKDENALYKMEIHLDLNPDLKISIFN